MPSIFGFPILGLGIHVSFQDFIFVKLFDRHYKGKPLEADVILRRLGKDSLFEGFMISETRAVLRAQGVV